MSAKTGGKIVTTTASADPGIVYYSQRHHSKQHDCSDFVSCFPVHLASSPLQNCQTRRVSDDINYKMASSAVVFDSDSAKQHVHFASMVKCLQIFPITWKTVSGQDGQGKNQHWYTRFELKTFREQVRVDCRRLKTAMVGANCTFEDEHRKEYKSRSRTTAPDRRVTMALDCESRGLESRICLERHRRRYLTNRCVVDAQWQLPPNRLADLENRCSRWAVELAIHEAYRDYERAYGAKCHRRSDTSQQMSVCAKKDDGAVPVLHHDCPPFEKRKRSSEDQFVDTTMRKVARNDFQM